MTDLYALRNRPLWQWVLRAIAPGLICDALGVLAIVVDRAKSLEDAASHGETGLVVFVMSSLLLAPLIGLIYLVRLGRTYVKAGMSNSSINFVIGYGSLNLFLWGAGCAMVCTRMQG